MRIEHNLTLGAGEVVLAGGQSGMAVVVGCHRGQARAQFGRGQDSASSKCQMILLLKDAAADQLVSAPGIASRQW